MQVAKNKHGIGILLSVFLVLMVFFILWGAYQLVGIDSIAPKTLQAFPVESNAWIKSLFVDQESWLAYFLISLDLISLCSWLAFYFQLSRSRWRVVLMLMGLLMTIHLLLLSVSVEQTAFLMAMAAGGLHIQALRKTALFSRMVCSLGAMLLAGLSMLFYFPACFFVLLILGPLLIFQMIFYIKSWRSQLLINSCMALGCFGLLWYQLGSMAKSPTQKINYQFQQQEARIAIQDYDWEGYRWNEEIQGFYSNQLGWSFNDYQLFKSGFMADSSLFALAKLEKLSNAMQGRRHYSQQGVWARWQRWGAAFWPPSLLLLLVLAMALSTMISDYQQEKVLAWGLAFGQVLALAFLVWRISFYELSMAELPIYGVVIFYWGQLTVGLRGWLSVGNKWTLLLVYAGLAVYSLHLGYHQLSDNKRKGIAVESLLSKFSREEGATLLYRVPEEELPASGARSLFLSKQADAELLTTQVKQFYEERRLEAAELYLLAQEQPLWASYYQQYLIRHHRISIRWDSLSKDEETGLIIWQMKCDSL